MIAPGKLALLFGVSAIIVAYAWLSLDGLECGPDCGAVGALGALSVVLLIACFATVLFTVITAVRRR